MRSVVLDRPFSAGLQDRPEPRLEPGTALLRMTHGGVCGSDLASYRGVSAYVSYPRVVGHELAAEVVAVDGDTDLVPGTAVTALPYFSCGACFACRRGHRNACQNNETMGVQREGAFSDLLVLPLERVYDGTGVDPRALALVEPFSISYHGVRRAQVREGERVLVLGAGSIGILAAVAARSMGASAWVVDVAPAKVEAAVRDFGLDGGIVAQGPEDLAEQVAALTDGDGFDVAVEAAGSPAAFLRCVESTASLGRVVVIGVSTRSADFNATVLQRKELTITGSRNATPQDFADTMRLARDGGVDLTRLITREWDVDEATAAFAELHEDWSQITKTILRF